MPKQVSLQLEYQSTHLHYGRSDDHPVTINREYWQGEEYGTVLYPTKQQCERFALRIERLIRNESKYLNLADVMLLIDLDNGKHYITHSLAYPGQMGADDSVYEANRRFIAHEYANDGIIMGGIAYMPLTLETIELIAKLDDYPVFDDEYVSEVELEQEAEAWKDWIRRDIMAAIRTGQGGRFEHLADLWDELPDDVAYQFYRDAMESTNTYFESNYVDVNDIYHAIATDSLESEFEAELANWTVCGVAA